MGIFLQFYTFLHVSFYKLSGGRIGGRIHKANVLLLTTTGRKTGKKRTRPLLFLRDGNRLVIIPANGGRAKDPAWWTNLKRNPIGEVQVGNEKETVYAQKASGSEKDRLWALVTGMYPEYNEYQKKTKREISVVVLTRKAPDYRPRSS
jgi:deazaflavin-dependent oxidoreductase (nitroreductase family)